MGLSGYRLQAMICVTSAFAFLLFGYDQGVMGGLVNLTSFQNRFQHPNPALLGFMVASYDVGCLLGAVCAFIFGDKTGRRWAITLACMVLCVGATLQSSAFSREQYIIGRIVAGLGTGVISVTVPVYTSECVHARHRGILVVAEVSTVTFGVVVSNLTNYGFVYGNAKLKGTEAQWRIPIALQMMFPVFVFVLMPFCVESPRWLAARGRFDEVAVVLARLEGRGATPTTPNLLAQAKEIIDVARYEAAIDSSWKEALSMGELQNFRRLFISGALGVMHQATGINAVVYYAPVVFQQVGLAPRLAYILSAVGSIIFWIGAVAPVLYIERMGRRKVMIMGAATTATCMGVIACCIGIGINFPQHKSAAGWAATAFIFLFEFSFGIGWNSLAWLYGSEICSLRMRNKGAAVQCTANWSTNFLTVMTAPYGFSTLSWRFYLIWMSITIASIPFLFFCYPETTGRTLEQMDYFFKKYQRWNIADVANEWVVREDVVEPQQEDKTATAKIDEKEYREDTV